MADNFDTGPPVTGEAQSASAVMDPKATPAVMVFHDVASLVESLIFPQTERPTEGGEPTALRGVHTAAPPSADDGMMNGRSFPAPMGAGPVDVVVGEPSVESAPAEAVTDEDRTRYGLLLDSAAERGLLDPTEYEIRLRELAEATSTAQMVEIVAELPAFGPGPGGATPTRSRRAIQSATRAGRPAGQRRRLITWLLLGLLVVVALASLVILAISAERLSRSRNSSLPPPPAATRPVSALRL